MGLDMYLRKKTYITNEEKEKIEIKEPFSGIKTNRIEKIIEEIMYWRKENAIHQWFVKNVQDGNDDCKTYAVTLEDLKNLLSDINEVLEDRLLARKILPTQEGFFFGTTEYDEEYFKGLETTKNELIEIIKEAEKEGNTWKIDYEYEASW